MEVGLKLVVQALSARSPALVYDDIAEVPVGYLVIGATEIAPAQVSFMVNQTRGVICLGLEEARLRELGLPPMSKNSTPGAPDMTVSIEARQGVSTGISSEDRAETLKVAARTDSLRRDLVTPGHIFPLRAKQGGVLVRNTIAEAALDLLKLAGEPLAAALSHCLDEHGKFSSLETLYSLSANENIPLVRISEIIRYRLVHEVLIEEIATARLPTQHFGEFKAICFRSLLDGAEHLALVKGKVDGTEAILVRVQAEHQLGDLFGLSGSRTKLRKCLKQIEQSDAGVFVYIRHPRRGSLGRQAKMYQFGVSNSESAKAPELAREPDMAKELRETGVGVQILRALGISRIRLISNATRDIPGLKAFDIEIVERVAPEE